MSDIGLYIHVPFCLSKCPYCDFYSDPFSEDTARAYSAAVVRNLSRRRERFDTVYFGGGTPILLHRYIESILSAADIRSGAEITAEANPCLCTEQALDALKRAGVNRLSIGVQSFDDRELSALGRRHTAAEAERAVLAASAAGFDNISIDLMLAIPYQTAESLERTVERAAALPITHVSAYLLKIEPNTVFGKRPPDTGFDEDSTAEIYLKAVRLLERHGFAQYEISSFSRAGVESRHNLKYWRREEYLGIGAAAHSFLDGVRFAVPRSVRGFIDAEIQPTEITDSSPNEEEERIMLGLRLSEGIEESLWRPHENRLRLVPDKYYSIKGGRLALTAEGFLLSNEIISLLLS